MDMNAKPLREYMAPLSDLLEAYQMDDMVRVLWVTVEADCNWKVIHDNFNESYHLPTLHRELATFIEEDYQQTQFDMYPSGHNRMIEMGCLPSSRNGVGDVVETPLKEIMEYWELNPDDFKGRTRDVRRAIQQQKRKLGPARGHKIFETLSDDQLTDYHHCTCFPNFSLTFCTTSPTVMKSN